MESNIKNDPIYQAKELGISIIESKEYTFLKNAEKDYNNDVEASSLMNLYDENMAVYNKLTAMSDRNLEKEKEVIDRIKEIKTKIDSNSILENLYRCQKDYDSLIKSINDIIDYMTGNNNNNKSECGSNCGGCSKTAK